MPRLVLLLLCLVLAGCALLLLTTQYYALALAPVLLVPVLSVFFRRSVLAYYLIIGLVPFSTLRALSGEYASLTVSKLAGVALVVIVALRFLTRKGQALPLGSNLWKWLLPFAGLSLLSTMASTDVPLSLDTVRGLVTAYLIFAMTLLFIDRDRLAGGLLLVLVLSISANSLLSLAGYAFGIESLAMDVTAKSLKRAVGASGNPNHFACMVIFGIPLLVHVLAQARLRLARVFWAGLLGVNIMAVVFTFSRSGALILALTLGLCALAYLPRLTPRQLGVVGSGLVTAGLLVVLAIPGSYWERQRTLASAGDPSIARRLSYVEVALFALAQRPVLGQGPGTFERIYSRSLSAQAFGGASDIERAAHNTYLEVLVGMGIPGLALLGLCILTGLGNFRRARKGCLEAGDRDMAALVTAYRTSFLSLLAYFVMLSSFTHKYFWMSLALSQVCANVFARAPDPQTDPVVETGPAGEVAHG